MRETRQSGLEGGAAFIAPSLPLSVGGTSATGAGDQFTYVAAPTITSLGTTSGTTAGGTSVAITGTNLTGATAVKFGATNAASFTVNSATSITATSPAGSAGTVDITVTTAGGTSATSAADQYTYASLPTVTTVTPSQGVLGGGTAVTIAGTNFTGATGVTFGGTAATSVVVVNPTTITCVVPAAAVGGPVSVIVTTPSGSNAANIAYAYVQVPVVLTAGGTLSVDGTGSTSGLNTSVTKVGSNLIVTDPNNVLGYGPSPTFTPLHTITIPFASVTTLTLTGSDQNDYFTLDFSSDLPPTINIDGRGQTGPPGDGMSIKSLSGKKHELL